MSDYEFRLVQSDHQCHCCKRGGQSDRGQPGGGNFPGLDGSKTIVASPDNNREILIAYVSKEKNLTRVKNGSARSWRFARVATKGPVVFHSAPNVIALAKDAGIDNVTQLQADDGAGKGFALYQVDLSK
jgi:2',3'-cyclic-nucleotide 2'-phosphodiesterase/3'-nucleotidase